MKDRERHRFEAEELAVVLSHYDLGAIESITEFDRGSRRSPKVGVVAERGKYLLKKRAAGRRSTRRVALAHSVQARLAASGFPAPGLVPTRDGSGASVRREDDLYELFEFVQGHRYSQTIEQTRDAGRLLGRFHETLRGEDAGDDPPSRGYHDDTGVRGTLNAIPAKIAGHKSMVGREAELPGLVRNLFDAYDRASDAVDRNGFASLEPRVVHGDWHPGNMLFKRDAVVAVVDYDSCHVGRSVTDLANGALQFSLTTAERIADWPAEAARDRFDAFVAGYGESASVCAVECSCVPHLMIEALIGEAVFPVVRGGEVSQRAGFGFLEMVSRKVAWIEGNAEDLTPGGGLAP